MKIFKKIVIILIFSALCLCNGGFNEALGKKKTITINSSSSNIMAGDTQSFKAKLKPSGKPFSKVEWSISGISGIDNGIIDESGVYTAPSSITYTEVITDSEGIASTVNAKAIDITIKAKSLKSGVGDAKKSIVVYNPPAVLDISIKPSRFMIVVKKSQKLSLKVKKKGRGAASDVSWHLFVNGNEKTDGSAGKIVKSKGKIYYKAPSKKKDMTVFIVARSKFDETRITSAKAIVTKKKPKLVISGRPPIIDFGTVVIGEDVTERERTFSLVSSTNEAVGWQVTNIPSWLSVEPLNDITPSNVILRVSSTSSLRGGFNQGTVVFKSQKAGYKQAKIRASINATEP